MKRRILLLSLIVLVTVMGLGACGESEIDREAVKESFQNAGYTVTIEACEDDFMDRVFYNHLSSGVLLPEELEEYKEAVGVGVVALYAEEDAESVTVYIFSDNSAAKAFADYYYFNSPEALKHVKANTFFTGSDESIDFYLGL